jgi:hypothetical protein
MNPDRWPPARRRLLLFVLLALLAEVLLITALRPHGGANIVALELAPSAAVFASTVQRDWTQDASAVQAEPLCGLGLPHTAQATARTSLGKLRCNLALDSLALVPGYVGLLVIFTLGLLPRGTHGLRALAWCLPAIAAGTADLLENGLTLQALALLGQPALGDGLIGAVRSASQAKWLLLAVALAALGHLGWHAPAAGATLRRMAAVLCALAALALPLGAWWWQGALGLGMAAMVLALALLAWRAWRAVAA